tara:strand:- start:1925 stop:2245 length:321 start_codon:yes stop_codon:yes gene_type:complete
MKKTIYIAGKVTGVTEAECLTKFCTQEKALKELGYNTVNPILLVGNSNMPWQDAMKICIRFLMTADAVFALPCVETSKGAQLELKLCGEVGIPVFACVKTLKKAMK